MPSTIKLKSFFSQWQYYLPNNFVNLYSPLKNAMADLQERSRSPRNTILEPLNQAKRDLSYYIISKSDRVCPCWNVIRNSLSTFQNRGWKWFALLCKVLVSLWLMTYFYYKVGYSMLFLLSWLAHFHFNTSPLDFSELVKMDPKYWYAVLFNLNVIFCFHILYVISYI